jgi:hypothetical protein
MREGLVLLLERAGFEVAGVAAEPAIAIVHSNRHRRRYRPGSDLGNGR